MHKHEDASTTVGDDGALDVKAGEDPDMQRALDLVELHYGVKMKHVQGEDAALTQARREVDMVLEKAERHSLNTKGSGR